MPRLTVNREVLFALNRILFSLLLLSMISQPGLRFKLRREIDAQLAARGDLFDPAPMPA